MDMINHFKSVESIKNFFGLGLKKKQTLITPPARDHSALTFWHICFHSFLYIFFFMVGIILYHCITRFLFFFFRLASYHYHSLTSLKALCKH